MELGLNGKTNVITGGRKGTGLACALAFLAEEGLKLEAKTSGVSEEEVLAQGQASVPSRCYAAPREGTEENGCTGTRSRRSNPSSSEVVGMVFGFRGWLVPSGWGTTCRTRAAP